MPFHEPGFSWFRLETLWPFGFQGVAYSGNLQLTHAPRPSPGFLWSTGRPLGKSSMAAGAMGTLQMLCERSLPDVWAGMNIPGMSFRVASSITVPQLGSSEMLSPNPSPVGLPVTFPALLAGNRSQEPCWQAAGQLMDGHSLWCWAEPS